MIKAVNIPYTIHNLQLANGCNVAYIDEGKGDTTLVFIHGLATYGLSWQKNIDTLKKSHRCIAIDLPGNGFSDRGDYPYTINFFSGCVYDLILKLKLKNVCLVGHSMGGQIAMHLMINQPDVAERLVLCAPAGFEIFTPFEATMYKSAIGFADMFSTDENNIRQSVYSSFYNVPAQGETMIKDLVSLMNAYPIRTYRRMIDACVAGMLAEPVFDKLKQIEKPVLVLFGERDGLIPNMLIHPTSTKAIAEKGVKQMKKAKLIIIPRCGHFLQIEKAPEVNAAIREFLAG